MAICKLYKKLLVEKLDCVHSMLAQFGSDEKCNGQASVHTITEHILPADFENGTLTGTF